jgi:arginase
MNINTMNINTMNMNKTVKYCLNNFRCAFGQKKNGAQLGGDMILQNFMRKKSRQLSVDIKHIDINNYTDYLKGYKQVQENLQKGQFNINLGGDHSIAAATVQPLLTHYKDDLLVIWIDAHADLNTYDSSLTKNIHGMPVGALTGLMDHWYKYDKSIRSNYNKQSTLAMQNLLYIGIRDLDPFEQETIITHKIPHFPTYTSEVIQTIKAHPAQQIHISCDIDSMDPHIMPSTGTPVPNGLALKNVLNIIKAAKPRLIGFDLVEFNPLLGNKRQVRTTLNNIHRILTKVMDK